MNLEIVTTIKQADEVLKRLRSVKATKPSYKKIDLIERDYFSSVSYFNF